MVRRLVDEMSGAISVADREPLGASIIVTIPFPPQELANVVDVAHDEVGQDAFEPSLGRPARLPPVQSRAFERETVYQGLAHDQVVFDNGDGAALNRKCVPPSRLSLTPVVHPGEARVAG